MWCGGAWSWMPPTAAALRQPGSGEQLIRLSRDTRRVVDAAANLNSINTPENAGILAVVAAIRACAPHPPLIAAESGDGNLLDRGYARDGPRLDARGGVLRRYLARASAIGAERSPSGDSYGESTPTGSISHKASLL
jgi:hypothetical protein